LITESQAAQKISISKDIEFLQLAENVWLHTTYIEYPGYGRIPANGLVVIDGANAAMIDTPWNDEQTGMVFDWVEKNHNATITHVIVGHSHDDCMGGLAEAHRRGATSYALDLTQEKAEAGGLPVPQTVFSESLALMVGDTKLILHYFGSGHTIDNIVTWLPESKILFGGCLIKAANAKNLGNTKEADLEHWSATVQTVLDAFPEAEIVVPGHGAYGGKELLSHTIELCNTHVNQ
jgi:metallo-beta-lactamase class B